MDINIANSWFTLAQILSAIAGYSFVACAMSLSYSGNVDSTRANLESKGFTHVKYTPKNPLDKFLIQHGVEMFFWLGIILSILSITFWFIGRLNLS